jgi:hypothetical protein
MKIECHFLRTGLDGIPGVDGRDGHHGQNGKDGRHPFLVSFFEYLRLLLCLGKDGVQGPPGKIGPQGEPGPRGKISCEIARRSLENVPEVTRTTEDVTR